MDNEDISLLVEHKIFRFMFHFQPGHQERERRLFETGSYDSGWEEKMCLYFFCVSNQRRVSRRNQKGIGWIQNVVGMRLGMRRSNPLNSRCNHLGNRIHLHVTFPTPLLERSPFSSREDC
jgi:hypothetical protein